MDKVREPEVLESVLELGEEHYFDVWLRWLSLVSGRELTEAERKFLTACLSGRDSVDSHRGRRLRKSLTEKKFLTETGELSPVLLLRPRVLTLKLRASASQD